MRADAGAPIYGVSTDSHKENGGSSDALQTMQGRRSPKNEIENTSGTHYPKVPSPLTRGLYKTPIITEIKEQKSVKC